jgi:hypothetical protein
VRRGFERDLPVQRSLRKLQLESEAIIARIPVTSDDSPRIQHAIARFDAAPQNAQHWHRKGRSQLIVEIALGVIGVIGVECRHQVLTAEEIAIRCWRLRRLICGMRATHSRKAKNDSFSTRTPHMRSVMNAPFESNEPSQIWFPSSVAVRHAMSAQHFLHGFAAAPDRLRRLCAVRK